MSKNEQDLPLDSVAGKPLRVYQQDGKYADYSTEDIVAQKLNSFFGWKCAAGVENLCISFDGDVQSASCGSIGPHGKPGKYGNIFETFKLDSEWMTCAQKFCSCGADLFIPKVKSSSHRNHLTLTTGRSQNTLLKQGSVTSPVASERTFNARKKSVLWEIGRRCNFDCSYCHPFVHNNFEEHKTLEKLLFATKRLEESFARGEKMNFSISGGEPTINPDFLDWVKYLYQQGHKVSTHSNGTRQPDYYCELIKYSDLNISVHFEFYQPSKLLEVLTALAREIHIVRGEGNFAGHLEVMLMMMPGKKNEVQNFAKEIWEIANFSDYCTLTFMPIRGHESIDTDHIGDVLLSDYQDEELDHFGNLTRKELNLRAPESQQLIVFDHLDDMTNSEERLTAFNFLAKAITKS